MHQRKMKTIGILGGMGPLASATVYTRIISGAQEQYNAQQDIDYPPIALYSLPLYGFDETGITDIDLVKSQLVDGVKILERSGSDFIVIACNTVHIFMEEMRGAVSIPIIDLPLATIKRVVAQDFTKVGLISSATTRESCLYLDHLNEEGMCVVNVTDEEQKTVNDIILHVMKGDVNSVVTESLCKIMRRLIVDGAEAIILACTELPLVDFSQVDTVPIYDTIDIAAKESLERSSQI